jgi:hypothetical protein
MARLSHLASKPSFGSSNDFSFSANTARYISLREALNLTARGEMKARDFYDQSPKDLCNLLNEFSQATFGKTFLSLKTEEQKEVCGMLAVLVFEVEKKEQKDFHQMPTPKIVADKPQPKGIIQRIKNFFGWF